MKIPRLKTRTISQFLLCILGLGAIEGCTTTPRSVDLPPPQPKPFGSVWVDAGRRELVVSGFVNQVSGPIELLACGPGGKTHESTFVLQAKPQDVQAGLLLLGLQSGTPMPGRGMKPPEGDAVLIFVAWESENGSQIMPGESFLLDVKTQRKARHRGWVFTGSVMENGLFMANAEENIIATYWDPWAIINLGSELGADDERLVVLPDQLPPKYTPVRMIIRAVIR